MATLADLKTRIITETNRDDLSDDLASQLTTALSQTVSYYANQRFWFNESIQTAPCVIGNEYVTVPATLVVLDGVSCLVGAIKNPLRKRSLLYIEDIAGAVNTQGQPTDYAQFGGQVRLWPKPSQTYTLTFVGIVNPGLPASDASNFWTAEAQDLVVNRAKMLLYRDTFRDADGAQMAAAAEADALSSLISQTGRMTGTGRMRASW